MTASSREEKLQEELKKISKEACELLMNLQNSEEGYHLVKRDFEEIENEYHSLQQEYVLNKSFWRDVSFNANCYDTENASLRPYKESEDHSNTKRELNLNFTAAALFTIYGAGKTIPPSEDKVIERINPGTIKKFNEIIERKNAIVNQLAILERLISGHPISWFKPKGASEVKRRFSIGSIDEQEEKQQMSPSSPEAKQHSPRSSVGSVEEQQEEQQLPSFSSGRRRSV